jgi:hypothetical protein
MRRKGSEKKWAERVYDQAASVGDRKWGGWSDGTATMDKQWGQGRLGGVRWIKACTPLTFELFLEGKRKKYKKLTIHKETVFS